MPIYEYKCNKCGSEVEIFVKSINTTAINCPQCGSDQLEKQWSVPGFLKSRRSAQAEMPCGHNREDCETPQCPANTGGCCGI
ncbi:MAG: zinc ribbon domain-containing protein [Candidatus Aminicenantes bacterium]|nr:zinc ribbon domain-containing protein [Candidatus Aminicenantes bacterium]